MTRVLYRLAPPAASFVPRRWPAYPTTSPSNTGYVMLRRHRTVREASTALGSARSPREHSLYLSRRFRAPHPSPANSPRPQHAFSCKPSVHPRCAKTGFSADRKPRCTNHWDETLLLFVFLSMICICANRDLNLEVYPSTFLSSLFFLVFFSFQNLNCNS